MKKPKSILWRLLLSAVLLALVAWKVDFTEVARHLKEIPLWVFLCIAAGYLSTQTITALRWHILLSSAGIACTRPRAIKATFIGMSMNAVGLGTIGGDLGKALLVSNSGQRALCIATVAADRLLGLGVLASIGVFASLFSFSVLPAQRTLFEAVALLVVLGGTAVWLLLPEILDRLGRIEKLRPHVTRLSGAFPRKRKVLVQLVSVAILYHAIQIGLVALMMHGVGIKVPTLYLFTAVPFINIASTLPLSWMGLGVREGLYVTFFSPGYMTAAQAVTLSAIWFIALTAGTVVGGLVALLSGAGTTLREGVEQDR